jgi:GNAT superfamily N-acetyltransferase
MSGRRAMATLTLARQRRQGLVPTVHPQAARTAADLLGGFPGPAPYTLHLARPNDGPAVTRLSQMAGVEISPRVLNDIEGRYSGDLTLKHLLAPHDGQLALTQHLATGDMDRTYAACTTVLVATHPDHGEPVGACVTAPPGLLLDTLADRGAPKETLLVMLRRARKLSSVAVAPDHRGSGLGRALLSRAVALAFAAGMSTVFGQIKTTDGLAGWYCNNGYTVLAPGEALDLSWLVGARYGVAPIPGEQLVAAMSNGKRPPAVPAYTKAAGPTASSPTPNTRQAP